MSSLLCSDLHMKDRDDERFALRQVADLAIARRVARVVAAGDLFDKQRNRSGPVGFFYKVLDDLQDAGVEFHYVQGQHCADDPPWLSGHRHARHLHGKTLKLEDGRVACGLDFTPFGALQSALETLPRKATVLFAHQTWADFMGSVAQPQGCFADVPERFSFVYTGDYHKYVSHEHHRPGGDPMAVLSTGATCMQKIDEPSTHYVALLHDDGAVERIALRSRPFRAFPPVTTDDEADAFLEKLPAAVAELAEAGRAVGLLPRVRITYPHDMPGFARKCRREIGEAAWVRFTEMSPEEVVELKTPDVKQPAKVMTLAEALDASVDPKEDPDAYELASRILDNPESFSEELLRWWTENTKTKEEA